MSSTLSIESLSISERRPNFCTMIISTKFFDEVYGSENYKLKFYTKAKSKRVKFLRFNNQET